MSLLFLLRHAKAEWARPGMRDFDRPLKDRGRRNAESIGELMREMGFVPDHVICSKATRAMETWQGVSRALQAGDCRVELTDSLYETDAAGYLRAINEAFGAEKLLVIGHNPMMEDVAFALTGGGDEAAKSKLEKGFPTAGMAAVEFSTPLAQAAPGKGVLRAFLTPSDI